MSERGAGKGNLWVGGGERTDCEDEGDDAAADPAYHLPAPGAAGAAAPGERRQRHVAGGPWEGGGAPLQQQLLLLERGRLRIHCLARWIEGWMDGPAPTYYVPYL